VAGTRRLQRGRDAAEGRRAGGKSEEGGVWGRRCWRWPIGIKGRGCQRPLGSDQVLSVTARPRLRPGPKHSAGQLCADHVTHTHTRTHTSHCNSSCSQAVYPAAAIPSDQLVLCDPAASVRPHRFTRSSNTWPPLGQVHRGTRRKTR
jgi:hypothetical protein